MAAEEHFSLFVQLNFYPIFISWDFQKLQPLIIYLMDRFSKRLINRSPCSLFVFSKRPFLFKVLFSLWDVISSCAVHALDWFLALVSTCSEKSAFSAQLSPWAALGTETLHGDTGGNIHFLGSNFCFAVKVKSKGIAGFTSSLAFAIKPHALWKVVWDD